MCKKWFNSILCVMFIIVLCGSDVQIANAQVKTEELEENVHYEYLQKFYGEGQERYVVDEQGNDVTKIFFDKTLKMFQQGNTEEIFQIMEEEGLVLHLITTKQVPLEVSLYGYDLYKTVRSDMIEFVLSDQYDNTTIYVQAELSGGIWYNDYTNEVTNVTNSTYNILSIDCNGTWEILTNNFSTGSNVVNGKGYFWGQCQFTGQGQQNLNGIVYDIDLDYGTKKVDFYAIP